MRKLGLFLIMLCLPLAAGAQILSPFGELFGLDRQSVSPRESSDEIEFDYDIDFNYLFDNREFNYGGRDLTRSCTIHGARLTPWAGVRIAQNRRLTHRVMLGADIMRNMGEASTVHIQEDPGYQNWKLFKELLFYYNASYRTGDGIFSATAGAFPRTMSEGEYSEAFRSDSLRFFDPNVEGMLFSYRTRSLYAEVGCDWMGRKGDLVRERFQIFSAASWQPFEGLTLGFAASMYHFAGCVEIPGVVDNALIQPYVRYDAGPLIGIQELSLKAGGLFSYQRDRIADPDPIFSNGAEMVFRLRHWNVCLQNTVYGGNDMMPYYDKGRGGFKFGPDLYFGSPFYRETFYDKLEAFWQPHIADFLDLRVSAEFHFLGEGFNGCQQKLALVFDLDALRHPVTVPGSRKGHGRSSHADSGGRRIQM